MLSFSVKLTILQDTWIRLIDGSLTARNTLESILSFHPAWLFTYTVVPHLLLNSPNLVLRILMRKFCPATCHLFVTQRASWNLLVSIAS